MLEGQQIGPYAVRRLLGHGGMSHVYQAQDVRLGRDVALKVLDERLARQPGFRERFLREARVAAVLDHTHIVPLFDVGEHPVLYLVMPFVAGGSIQHMLPRVPLAASEVANYGCQVADALGYAHRMGVIHRDVKPANILIHADGRAMLSDFGLAKIWDGAPRAPRRRPDAGTPEYMAPEQVRGQSDTRTDLYALGVVLYLLLTGRLPFTGATGEAVMAAQVGQRPISPRSLNMQLSPAMEAVVLRALAKQPEERFQTAADLSAALLAALVIGEARGPAALPAPMRRPVPRTLPIS
ncbi:MAG TPA: serine/threonine-protein kinase [Ktedonobacterales bacterium]|jgi:serine/threonine-protein kinase